jgi:hypothetical protein
MPLACYERGADADIARAVEDAQLALRGGFNLPPTVVPFGTKVIAEGEERYNESRATWERTPVGDDALRDFRNIIVGENRLSHVGRANTLVVMPDGTSIGVGPGVPKRTALLTEHAAKQLCNFEQTVPRPDGEKRRGKDAPPSTLQRLIPPGAYTYLWHPMNTPAERAAELNKHLHRAHYPGEVADIRGGLAGPAVQLRNRDTADGTGREVFAIVGPKWNTEADGDKVAELLLAPREDGSLLIPAGARGQIKYDRTSTRWSMDLLWHSSLDEGESPVAGELFKGGVRIQSADNGSQGIEVKSLLWRNLCLNFGIIGVAAQSQATRHNRRELARWLSDAIATAFAQIEGFTSKWGDAYKTKLLGRDWDSPSDAFEALINNRYLVVPPGSGLTKDDYRDQLVRNYHAEAHRSPKGYFSVADAYNAVSRAHTNSWQSPFCVQHEEEQAGNLYQTVKVWRA